jgi:hypothetical protein
MIAVNRIPWGGMDVGKYTSLRFEAIIPTGANFGISLQCGNGPSVNAQKYTGTPVSVTNYVTPNGTLQSVSIPMQTLLSLVPVPPGRDASDFVFSIVYTGFSVNSVYELDNVRLSSGTGPVQQPSVAIQSCKSSSSPASLSIIDFTTSNSVLSNKLNLMSSDDGSMVKTSFSNSMYFMTPNATSYWYTRLTSWGTCDKNSLKGYNALQLSFAAPPDLWFQ